jgi:general nucleoside transport system permease protein
MSGANVAAFLAQGVRISVPYLFAALGGLLCERSGVINIALEGILLLGAFGAAVGSLASSSALVGALTGVGAGVLLAALYGVAVLRFRADQIVSGVAATLLAAGASRFFLKLGYHSASNSPRLTAVGSSWILVTLAIVLVVTIHWFLRSTPLGLRLRAAGEHPEAARTLGVRVQPLRWWGVLASGVLAGLGGVWLAFDQHQFVAGMSAGRGFVALAAMILGGWRPAGALLGCLVFGFAEAVELRLQSSALALAPGTVQSIPYLVTIVALALSARGRRGPKALGQDFED